MDNLASTHEEIRELALFAGAGGGILGGLLLGWRTVCAVEIEPYPRDVLVARQNDGCLPPFPIWDDIRTFDGKPWRGIVDVVSGGFPCQDISTAGNGRGIEGERSGLWREMARIVSEVRPRWVWVENSPALVSRGLALVLCDFASMGYDARWGVVGADDAGAPQNRKRIWILAYANKSRCEFNIFNNRIMAEKTESKRSEKNISPISTGPCGENLRASEKTAIYNSSERMELLGYKNTAQSTIWEIEPSLGRMVDGLANHVDRLAAIGNGQVPAVVRLAWEILSREE